MPAFDSPIVAVFEQQPHRLSLVASGNPACPPRGNGLIGFIRRETAIVASRAVKVLPESA